MIRKTKEEILRPYIITLLLAGLVSLFFGYLLDNSQHKEWVPLPAKQDSLTIKDRSEITDYVENQTLDENAKEKLNKLKRDSLSVNPNNFEDLNLNIDDVILKSIDEVNRYIKLGVYEKIEHTQLYYKIQYLYAIPGLEIEQNKALKKAIIVLNLFKESSLKELRQSRHLESSSAFHVTKVPKYHVVLPNETLYTLSKKYHVSERELIRLNPNKIKGVSIFTGDSLIVEY